MVDPAQQVPVPLAGQPAFELGVLLFEIVAGQHPLDGFVSFGVHCTLLRAHVAVAGNRGGLCLCVFACLFVCSVWCVLAGVVVCVCVPVSVRVGTRACESACISGCATGRYSFIQAHTMSLMGGCCAVVVCSATGCDNNVAPTAICALRDKTIRSLPPPPVDL
jgi:hypothetical protein